MQSWSLCLIFCVFFAICGKSSAQSNCVIPNQRTTGKCIPEKYCSTYAGLMAAKPLTTERLNFIVRLQCDVDRICCPNVNDYYRSPFISVANIPKKVRPPLPEEPETIGTRMGTSGGDNELPSKEFCGPVIPDNKIFGGKIAKIDDFPWTALLIYQKDSESIEYGCGGSLINKRYVLTAAHCITGRIYETKGELVKVRLGEYNIENENEDCIIDLGMPPTKDCTDGSIDIGVEEKIPHPEYSSSSKDKYNDIALIRLSEPIEKYTFFIKPICLPDNGFNTGVAVGNNHTVAGWGKTENYRMSPVKYIISLPIVEKGICSRSFIPQSISVGSNQICAGGINGKDTCIGDSGNCLAYLDKATGRYVASGIVSYGHSLCGTPGIPGVYTDVKMYMTWIKETLRA